MENMIFNRNKINRLKEITKPKIGWFATNTPEEIIIAAGLHPFRITGEMAKGAGRDVDFMGRNVCSYARSCLDEGMSGIYDFVDGFIFSNPCDARIRIYDYWRLHLNPNYHFFLDMPKKIDKASKMYFRMQIHKMISSIEAQYNVVISNEKLLEAIKICNKTRMLIREINEMRKKGDISISTNDLIDVVNESWWEDKQVFNAKLEEYISILKELSHGPTKGKKILISGSFLDNKSLIEMIENSGSRIMCEDISNGLNYYNSTINESDDSVGNIVDFYYNKGLCYRMIDFDTTVNKIVRLVEEYDIDKMIFFTMSFCDKNLINFPYVRKELISHGIPVLLIEGERNMFSIENLKTRIQTFIEV